MDTTKLKALLKELDKMIEADRYLPAAAIAKEIEQEAKKVQEQCGLTG